MASVIHFAILPLHYCHLGLPLSDYPHNQGVWRHRLCWLAMGDPDSHWRPGQSLPSCRRGKKRIWNEAGWQLMINLILNVERLPAATLHAMRVDLCDRDDEKIVRNQKQVCPLFIVAKLSGMHQRTVEGYADMFRQGKSPMLMEEYVSPTEHGTPVVESAQLPECLEAPSELVAIGTSEDYDEMWID